ncbi:hypothetical protein ACW95P_03940 [Candidatus Mycoplasma pogonae]
MKDILSYLFSLNLNFKIIIQGSFALKKYNLISREPADIDILFSSDEKNIELSDKKWSILMKNFDVTKKIIDNDIFKKYEVNWAGKKIIFECLLTKNISSEMYKIIKNNVYIITKEYALLTKISQLSKIIFFDTIISKEVNVNKLINVINDIDKISLKLFSKKFIFKCKKILYKSIHLDNITWFFYFDYNMNLFLKNFNLLINILKKFKLREHVILFLEYIYIHFFNNVVYKKMESSDIFISNKNLLMHYLEKKKFNQTLDILDTKGKIMIDLFIENKNIKFTNQRIGNVINYENANSIFYFLKKVFFVKMKNKLNIDFRIVLKLKRDANWNLENLTIANDSKLKNIFKKNKIPFVENALLKSNEIAIPISEKENKIILENIFLMINFLNVLI